MKRFKSSVLMLLILIDFGKCRLKPFYYCLEKNAPELKCQDSSQSTQDWLKVVCEILPSTVKNAVVENGRNPKNCDIARILENYNENKFLDIYFQPDQSTVVDPSWLRALINSYGNTLVTLHFNRIKGLQMASVAGLCYFYNLEIRFYSRIDFYNRDGEKINECIDFEEQPVVDKKSQFSSYEYDAFVNLLFETISDRKEGVCDLAFRYANIGRVKFFRLADTYFKTNLIRFQQSKYESINSTVTYFVLDECYDIDLDSNLMNRNVFEKVNNIWILGELRSIETDLFKPFRNIRSIVLLKSIFFRLLHAQGNGWIRSINSDLNVNLSNCTQIDENRDRLTIIRNVKIDKEDPIYNDEKEDFCLFSNFPFNQMVVLEGFFLQESCMHLWITHHSNILQTPDHKCNQYLLTGSKCKFKQIIARCNKASFSLRKNHRQNKYTSIDKMVITEFLLLVVLSPLISLIGIVTNTLIVLVIVYKDNQKDMKEKQYKYMAIHSVINILIYLVHLIGLMSECQMPYGLFCSSIRHHVVIQYFKIILVEYFGFFFRLISNFTYVAFGINRLSLVGKDHNKLTKFFSEVEVKKYLAVCIILSGGLSVIKALRYDVNTIMLEESTPIVFNQDLFRKESKTSFNLKIIFNFICDFINYVLFVIANFIIDVILLKKLKEVMQEREEKFKEQSEQAKEKLKIDNRSSYRRVILMVVLSSFINILLKFPSTVASFNDLFILNNLNSDQHDNTEFDAMRSVREYYKYGFLSNLHRHLCFQPKFCDLFKLLSNFFIIISLSINLFFLKRFDKNFSLAYQVYFKGKENVKKATANNKKTAT